MSYVHGYSARESERLQDQSNILEELLHSDTTFENGSVVLEAGCGIGAQTQILAKRSPGARFTSVDISEESLSEAQQLIKEEKLSNVTFQKEDILAMSFSDDTFDHIFICFVLEHLELPLVALKELKRVLKPNGSITVIEGDHGSCFWFPETLESKDIWSSLVKAQQDLGHDPIIGRKLYPLLEQSGYQVKNVLPKWIYADSSNPELLDGVVNRIIVPMVESAKEQVLRDGILQKDIWDKGLKDLSEVGVNSRGTFFYTWFKGIALKL